MITLGKQLIFMRWAQRRTNGKEPMFLVAPKLSKFMCVFFIAMPQNSFECCADKRPINIPKFCQFRAFRHCHIRINCDTSTIIGLKKQSDRCKQNQKRNFDNDSLTERSDLQLTFQHFFLNFFFCCIHSEQRHEPRLRELLFAWTKTNMLIFSTSMTRLLCIMHKFKRYMRTSAGAHIFVELHNTHIDDQCLETISVHLFSNAIQLLLVRSILFRALPKYCKRRQMENECKYFSVLMIFQCDAISTKWQVYDDALACSEAIHFIGRFMNVVFIKM